MKFTEGGFKQWGYELAEKEFTDAVFTMNQYAKIQKTDGKASADKALNDAISASKLIVKDVICDAFLQNTLLNPQDYSVVATLNLNGDYVSDQLAAMVGGIGIAPGANINYLTGHAIFEATHGTAPNIAGQNQANPSSLLLSGVMMFDYLGWHEVGQLITKAMETLFQQGKATSDLARFMQNGQPLSTTQFTQAVIDNL
jgi:Isocitrate dehydrogenases